ncbi:hypothetical protein AMTRI_Chr04g246990 [Amborella trichopoda]|uniref:LRRK2 ARM repeat domain-containing protein n=1 Tax=Amborella trichopoda TaxID=13333 RepID=W1NMT3_AMBTC|nr:armadillo repeat-containing protein 6 [Amborella trichopoda]ERM96823.1 hypothetical protein AMTR_s00128p00071310 [Amborella trichopoda]|eukprot:XP_006829407.1 armadillo repeat-containing protein 6 [Amborella trichopoda]
MDSSKKVHISQQAFDSLVRENMEDLGMDPQEALQDAIDTLKLQGVDLSAIIKWAPGVCGANENPVIQALDNLKEIFTRLSSSGFEAITLAKGSDECGFEKFIASAADLEEMVELLGKLHSLCCDEKLGNASIVTRNGGVELLVSICSDLIPEYERPLSSALRTLSSVLHDFQGKEIFRKTDGPKALMDILKKYSQNISILDGGLAVVTAAATGNEILKESFMDLKIDEFLTQLLRSLTNYGMPSLYDAIRALLTADDGRVLASQVYGYARRFAKIGAHSSLLDSLRQERLKSSSLIFAATALRTIAVNDEICRSIAESGGLDVVLQCIDDSGARNDKAVAKACCTLLCKLAGSDSNKSCTIQKGGLNILIKLSSRFSDDPSILLEIMSIVCALSLRSPENASAAIEAGVGDVAIEAMQKFPAAHQMQRQACLMIRNLVARNHENRSILLNNGIETLVRKAKENHESCKDAATAALRDLGLDNYNV